MGLGRPPYSCPSWESGPRKVSGNGTAHCRRDRRTNHRPPRSRIGGNLALPKRSSSQIDCLWVTREGSVATSCPKKRPPFVVKAIALLSTANAAFRELLKRRLIAPPRLWTEKSYPLLTYRRRRFLFVHALLRNLGKYFPANTLVQMHGCRAERSEQQNQTSRTVVHLPSTDTSEGTLCSCLDVWLSGLR